MDIQTYRAASLQEALQQVRAELGPDASILNTRSCGSHWLSWIYGRPQVEVTASRTIQVPSRVESAAESIQDDMEGPAVTRPLAASFATGAVDWLADLDAEGPSLVAELAAQPGVAGVLASDPVRYRMSHALEEEGIPADHLTRLMDLLPAPTGGSSSVEAMHVQLVEHLAEELLVKDPLQQFSTPGRTVALVGPSGTGKTTTLVKMAVQLQQQHRCRVGLVTTDIRRVTAVDQLRSYAEMFDLELAVVATPREMRRAREQMESVSWLLLDTPGCCPADRSAIRQLSIFLAEASAEEICLVLNSGASSDNMRESVEGFGLLGVTSLVLTKFDEAGRLGQLLPLLAESHLPVSYVSDGQGIPQDLQIAQPRWLAARILGYPRAPTTRRPAAAENVNAHTFPLG